MKRKTIWFFLFFALLAACTDSVPEPTVTVTQQPTATATAAAAAITLTATSTPSPTTTFTPVPTFTPTKTPIPTRQPTATNTPTSTPSPTLAPTATPLPPVLIPVNVSLPSNGPVIQPGNVGQLQEVARLGLGKAIQVEYAPNGSRVAVATPLGVYFYDTATYQQVGFIAAANQLYTIAFSPDWQTLAMGTILPNRYIQVELHRLPDGELLHQFATEERFELSVRFVNGGTQLAVGFERWQVSDGTQLPDDNSDAVPPMAEGEDFEAMTTSPDGQTAMVLTNKRLYQIQLSDNSIVKEIIHTEAYCETMNMEFLVFSPGESFIAAGGWHDCLWVWRVADLQPVHNLQENNLSGQRGVNSMAAPTQHTGPGSYKITGLVFSPDGQTLAAASGYGIVRLWNLQDGTLQDRFSVMHFPDVAYSPDGNTLAVWNGLIQFWQPDTRTLLATLENHFQASDIVLSPDMQQLFFLNNLYVQQWFIDQNQMRRLYGLPDFGMSLALSPDGQTFVTGDGDGNVWLWETNAGQPIRLLGRNGSPWGVSSVAYFPDGQYVLSTTHEEGIHQWAIDGTGEWIQFGDMFSEVLAISPTEPILAYDAQCCDLIGAEFVYLGETTPFLELQTPDEEFPGPMTFSPDGRLLAMGAEYVGGQVWLYDASSGQLLTTLFTQTDMLSYVESVAFSPDGQILAVAYYDQTIRLWRVSDGTLLHTVTLPHGYPTTILFSPDGQKLFSCGDDGVIRIWGING